MAIIPPAGTATPESCPYARLGLSFYRGRYVYWQSQRDAAIQAWRKPRNCADARYLANVWAERSFSSRQATGKWFERKKAEHAYQWNWQEWLPDKWARIGACETGYGVKPGRWRHSNSSYEGAFGFAKSSWDSFKYRADPKAGPYPEDAWQATPRQQWEVALAIWRVYGFSGWGCRNA